MSWGVETDGILAARALELFALVDVGTLAGGCALDLLVARLAGALEAAFVVCASSMASTNVAILAFIGVCCKIEQQLLTIQKCLKQLKTTHTNTFNAADLVARSALAVVFDAGRISGAIIVKLAGDIHRGPITAELG